MGSIISLAERTNRPAFVGSPEEENGGVRELALPDRYQKMPNLPGEPLNQVAYLYKSSGAECCISIRPIPDSSAMPFGAPLEVIHGLRDVMEDVQGLIEVKSGRTHSGCRYIYVIMKELIGLRGADYLLNFHLDSPGGVMLVYGSFIEMGKFGRREKAVRLRIVREAKSGGNMKALDTWEADPYDPGVREGALMNGSEYEVFDHQFPEHPLSEMRKLIKELIRLN